MNKNNELTQEETMKFLNSCYEKCLEGIPKISSKCRSSCCWGTRFSGNYRAYKWFLKGDFSTTSEDEEKLDI